MTGMRVGWIAALWPYPLRAGAEAARHYSVRSARAMVETLLGERERWALWTPVGLGTGIALYFALSVEPSPWLGSLVTTLALALAALARARPMCLIAALATAAVAAGFAAAQLRTARVDAPVLAETLRWAEVSGRIVAIEPRADGHRLVLEPVRIDELERATTPARVRITVRGRASGLEPGMWVHLDARLYPPSAPVAPGAFDFARRAYFARLGAVGFAFGTPRPIKPLEVEPVRDWQLTIGRLRHRVTTRIRSNLEGEAAAVAAALLTGERGAIGEDVTAAMRDAGLAHLLAISGLHLGLVAAIVFFTVRAFLALCEPLALRFPIKKWAAVAALAGTLAYMLLSGSTIPTQRAFLMGGLVMLAVLFDRTALTMRSVAWAASAVLLIEPESLLGPSFQMSFAAVIALVAVYEGYRARTLASWSTWSDEPRRGRVYLAGVALTTLVATAATAPFAIYHFNRLAAYGLVANMLAVPLTALWVMPWGVVALALMPVGLEAWALAPMGWGLEAIIAIARTVAAWPGAVTLFPAMPTAGLVVVVGGGLWLCLWRRRWRWLGAIAVASGLMTPMLSPRPDVLVGGEGKLFAVRTPDGALALSSSRAARFAGEIWLRRNGQRRPALWPDGARLHCDSLGCIYRAHGSAVALVRDGRALPEDCRTTEVVVSTVPVRRSCPSARTVVDRFDLWREGAHAIYLAADDVHVESVDGWRGERPWVARRDR